MGAAFAYPFLLAITIVGYNDMAGIFTNLNALFLQTHPGTTFKVQLKGTATAAPALTLGISDLAPMGAEFSAMELETYRMFTGFEPVAIRIAHCSLSPRALSAPVGIYVNAANPIENLTAAQISRIFTSGHPDGDIAHWGQAGLKGEWSMRPIHLTGIAEEAAAGLSSYMLKKMGDRPFSAGYEGFGQSTQVVQRIRDDPGAIGFASGNIALAGAKLVAIDGNPLTVPGVVSGKYPYDRHLLIYIRRIPGKSIDPLVKDYLSLALSREGQDAIAAAFPYYLRLNAQEAKDELAKLDLPPAPSSHAAGNIEPKIALYRLIAGEVSYALIGREIWPLEMRPFHQLYGYEATAIRIAHSTTLAVCINARNPLEAFTLEQLSRMFTTGGSNDITRWGQLGWTDRAIHLYGLHDDGTFMTALRHAKMNGFPFARGYEPLPSAASVQQSVADDLYGAAIVELHGAERLPLAVKVLPSADLSSYLTLYVNHAPGKPLDSATEQYARQLLSPEGQAKLANQGYQPLTAEENQGELKKL